MKPTALLPLLQPPISSQDLEVLVQAAWSNVRDEAPSLRTYAGKPRAFERPLMFRLGVQLDHLIRDRAASWDDGWSRVTVDSELSLAGDGNRKFWEQHSYESDLSVHVRGVKEFNLLVLEGKHGKGPSVRDRLKLRYLKGDPHFYRYAWAVNLQLDGALIIKQF